MKYIKRFELYHNDNKELRNEVWEMPDDFFDYVDDINYVSVALQKIGMSKDDINNFIKNKLDNILQYSNYHKIVQVVHHYLFFTKEYDLDYVQGYHWRYEVKTNPYKVIPLDTDFMGTIKIEDYELDANKYNL